MKYIPGMEKPLPDYSSRLARRSTTLTEDTLKGQLDAGRLTDEEALAAAKGETP